MDYFIKWDHKPEEIISKTHEAISYMNKTLKELIELSDDRTFENTITPIAEMEARVGLVKDPLNFYKSVHPSKEIREASKKSSEIFSKFSSEFWMRRDFYDLVN